MNHLEVVKRAWQTVWSYRALWIFGIILALVTFSCGTAVLFDGGDDEDLWQRGIVITQLDGETFWEAFQRTMRGEVDEANRDLGELLQELGIGLRADVRVIAAVLLVVAAVAFVAAKVARYVSETALIRMVGAHQATGERLSVGAGLRLGWSRSAWRLFLVNLLLTGLGVLAGLLLFGLILVPLPLWVNGSEGVIFTFAFITGGLFFVAIFVMILVAAALSAWKRLARQACALEALSVTGSIQQGRRILRRRLRDTGLTWLMTAGLELGWAVVSAPLVLLLIGLGLLIGSLPGLAAGGLASLATSGDTPVFVGLALGIPIFLLVLIAPLVVLGGLREAFVSSLWTLTFRELQGLERAEPEPLPVASPSSLEVAPAT
ncbi:MAG: hypothetical protein KGY78_09870 [Anaerolineae bacterium]|nr:hypothetical protein [Anaerolineae bacterium]